MKPPSWRVMAVGASLLCLICAALAAHAVLLLGGPRWAAALAAAATLAFTFSPCYGGWIWRRAQPPRGRGREEASRWWPGK